MVVTALAPARGFVKAQDFIEFRALPTAHGIVVQPIAASGEDAGLALVALDSIGAGVGEHVFFVRGREAAFPFFPAEPPADATVVGIVDHWTVG